VEQREQVAQPLLVAQWKERSQEWLRYEERGWKERSQEWLRYEERSWKERSQEWLRYKAGRSLPEARRRRARGSASLGRLGTGRSPQKHRP
jgi:hypothetical protein